MVKLRVNSSSRILVSGLCAKAQLDAGTRVRTRAIRVRTMFSAYHHCQKLYIPPNWVRIAPIVGIVGVRRPTAACPTSTSVPTPLAGPKPAELERGQLSSAGKAERRTRRGGWSEPERRVRRQDAPPERPPRRRTSANR